MKRTMQEKEQHEQRAMAIVNQLFGTESFIHSLEVKGKVAPDASSAKDDVSTRREEIPS